MEHEAVATKAPPINEKTENKESLSLVAKSTRDPASDDGDSQENVSKDDLSRRNAESSNQTQNLQETKMEHEAVATKAPPINEKTENKESLSLDAKSTRDPASDDGDSQENVSKDDLSRRNVESSNQTQNLQETKMEHEAVATKAPPINEKTENKESLSLDAKSTRDPASEDGDSQENVSKDDLSRRNTESSIQTRNLQETKEEHTSHCEDRLQHSEGNFKSQIDELFIRLNLKANHKLKPADILQIQSQSSYCQEPGDEKELVHTFLQRILMGNYRARHASVKERISEVDPIQSDTATREEGDTFADFFDLRQDSIDKTIHDHAIHPMDVQMAVLHCSDSFLKQLIVTKLSQCQYALPLLVPDPFTREIEFPLWTFRQIKKSSKTTDTSGNHTYKTMYMYKAETPLVAFFRLGSVSSSKSQLMNSLINEKHNTFFHRHCPGSSRTRLLMDGVVEITWYLPSGKSTDHFPDCVAFCNLHGDIETNKEQLEILIEMSSVNVVLLGDQQHISTNEGVLQRLFKGPKPLIYLLSENNSSVTGTKSLKYKIGLKDRSQATVSEELINTINTCLSKPGSTFRLEDVGKDRGIKTDENHPECQRGKEAALQITRLLEGMDMSRIKETFLPCQGNLWHMWCQKNKDKYKLCCNDTENQVSKIQGEMNQIRAQQKECGVTPFLELFIKNLNLPPSDERCYFLKWTEILLDKYSIQGLTALHQEYDATWSKLLGLKHQHDKSEEIRPEQAKLEVISEKVKATNFGLEHILREMGQIYESSVSLPMGQNEAFFPKFAAEIMLSGYPLELMDGDAGHVPLVWVSAVLDELIKILGDQGVFVLSVLGIQSSGKSTMLNAMFGLQFAVSAGRCTRGAFMQLVKVSEEMKAELKFDYILVVDTEGLQSPESTRKSTIRHDNELATFAIVLGNMTLINIFGESPAEIQDIFQITVHIFLKINKLRLNPSCMFIFQNVPDVTAKEKTMEGRQHLTEKLDNMTRLAALEEVCDAECFSDVIEFDVERDVRYIAQLWEGSPPMAPPNPSYSENIEELKQTIISKAAQKGGMKLSEFQTRIKDLWEALLNENFVFSFKNTWEISVYRKLEEQYGKWTQNLRTAMQNIIDKRIKNHLHKVEYKELVEEMKEPFERVNRSLEQYFEEKKKERGILQQWREKYKQHIIDLYEDLLRSTKTELDETFEKHIPDPSSSS
ncbi:interferon-induced very large GTPase 1-like [Brachyhypopomus gauderio]|uniref:interferon-induced very large GTPase 1-like n=1 Tax=Brachyhypopomus gauderio TaxID=698409 RepID=UPI004042513D